MESRGRPLILCRFAILLLVVRTLAGPDLWHIVPVPENSRSWLTAIVSGLIVGLVLLSVRRVLALWYPKAVIAAPNEYFWRGPSWLWLAIFVVGAFVEEFWRALCIIEFRHDGYTALSVVLLTAFAFGIAHLSGLPSRVMPGAGIAEMFVGLALGALFLWSGNFLAPSFASLIYFTIVFLSARRHLGEPNTTQ